MVQTLVVWGSNVYGKLITCYHSWSIDCEAERVEKRRQCILRSLDFLQRAIEASEGFYAE